MEYDGWLVIEEELMTNIDWLEHSNPSTMTSISNPKITATPQTQSIPILNESNPFWMDSGASVHISPDQNDFITLKTVSPRSVKGVGGSSVWAIGIGDIKICIGRGTHLLLKNVLYIPDATVRLISI
jgi:hypothetical protein